MSSYKGNLWKNNELVCEGVDVSIQSTSTGGKNVRRGQLVVPSGKKLSVDLVDPSFDLKLTDGNYLTIYIEERLASYKPHGSVETYQIRAIPNNEN